MAQPLNELEFEHVVFFGRRLEEYVWMFDLNLADMAGFKVLDCPSGPAAFAKQAADIGISVVACDPMYGKSAEQLRSVVDRDALTVAGKQAAAPDIFHPELVPTTIRRQDMQVFLDDYEQGKKIGRYVEAALPALPYADRSFDMVLSANLLFLYSDQESGGMMEGSPFDYEFHRKSVMELIRLCRQQVRIYPLNGPKVKRHSYLDAVIRDCIDAGHRAEVLPVQQRDLIGAEYMLQITRG